jgi:hypothetical protein
VTLDVAGYVAVRELFRRASRRVTHVLFRITKRQRPEGVDFNQIRCTAIESNGGFQLFSFSNAQPLRIASL